MRLRPLPMSVFPLGVSICAVLAACTGSLGEQAAAAHRPQALLDAYLIAHGMAASYAESPDANPAVVLQLARLDMRAAASVRSLDRPYKADIDATASAVAALTDYAARQSTATAQ
jgi:hypothetical protein